jgi:hypothetical protein
MLESTVCSKTPEWALAGPFFFPTHPAAHTPAWNPPRPLSDAEQDRNAYGSALNDDLPMVDWSEEDVVLLHWRLLQEVSRLADPATPLEEKFDTLRWVFTERAKDRMPFSFVSCLRVVGCSPLSPLPYCGRVDVEAVRDSIRSSLRHWLPATLLRYPGWVREAVARNPEWVEAHLARNPQWINEQVKRISDHGDLFA